MSAQQKPKVEKFICDCCPLPFATIRRNGVGLVFVVQSRHGGATHTNALTAEQLREIADIMDKWNKRNERDL